MYVDIFYGVIESVLRYIFIGVVLLDCVVSWIDDICKFGVVNDGCNLWCFEKVWYIIFILFYIIDWRY